MLTDSRHKSNFIIRAILEFEPVQESSSSARKVLAEDMNWSVTRDRGRPTLAKCPLAETSPLILSVKTHQQTRMHTLQSSKHYQMFLLESTTPTSRDSEEQN
ncbi:hypothetical protein MHYP_G00023130 [Metynnis hypsauchen]